MNKRLKWMAAAVTALVASSAIAADHRDGTEVTASPEADINDLYSWASGSTLKLIMSVHPFADSGSAFSDQVQYVFHVGSAAAPLAPPATNVLVLCQFDAAQQIECWVSDGAGGTADYVTGDASGKDGITSTSGQTRVFAGLANDPFFFYLTGFVSTRATVLDFATNTLQAGDVNAAGCPDLSAYPGTAAALQGLLSGNAGADATNEFATAQVLGISLEIDKALVTAGGENVSVWASTRNKGN